MSLKTMADGIVGSSSESLISESDEFYKEDSGEFKRCELLEPNLTFFFLILGESFIGI